MGKLRFVLRSVIVFMLLFGMLFQATGVAYADDGAPPDEPAATEEAPPADDEAAVTEEALPTDDEAAVTEEAQPADDEAAATEEALPAEDDAVTEDQPLVEEAETVADVVQLLDEADAVLLDKSGEPLPLATSESAELLESADPWFEDPLDSTQVVAYQSDCTGWTPPAGYAGGVCNTTATPIQDAVNAAPAGAVVNLEAGTFVEQITINKNLTLQGAGAGTTIIQAPDSLGVSFNNGQNNRAVIYVNNADVTIDGLTVDGDGNGNGNYRFIGIAYHNAGGTISNTEVTGIVETPFSGTQHGVAIYVYNADGTARTIDIDNNIITDYQKNGITVIGANLTANITDNTVTGAGPTGVIAQNGVQISGGAGGTITGNTITGNEYTGAGWTSTGVLLYDVDTVDVDGNLIADNQAGIYLFDGEANITDNDITGSTWGVIIAGSSAGGGTGTVTGNNITGNDLGLYVDNPAVPVNGNNITGNTDGVQLDDYYGIGGTLDATNNYWGCPEGPGAEGCDTVYGAVDASDPAAEPFVDEVGGGGNGNGNPVADDEDDDDDFALPHTGGGGYFSWSQLNDASMTMFALWNGGVVIFPPLPDSMARINVCIEDEMPLALPQGYTYQTGLQLDLTQGGTQVYNTGEALYSLGFMLPEGANPEHYVILYFNVVSGEWFEVVSYMTADGYLMADGNLLGMFVLATK